MPAASILTEFRALIDAAIPKARNVTVSSICPRLKPVGVSEKIKAVNADLQTLCAAKGVNFVDNEPSFSLCDGTINDGYLMRDGVHLTRAAVNKVACNLKLHAKDPTAGVCKDTTMPSRRQQRAQPERLLDRDNDDSWTLVRRKPAYTHAPVTTRNTTDTAKRPHERVAKQQMATATSRRTTPATTRRSSPATFTTTRQATHANERRTPAPKKCLFCGEGGHLRANCRHGHEVRCRRCNGFGHKAKVCTL